MFLRQIHFYFCWAFAFFHQGMVITLIFKIVTYILLERTIKTLYTCMSFYFIFGSHSQNHLELHKTYQVYDIILLICQFFIHIYS